MKRISTLFILTLLALTTQAVTVTISVLKQPTCTYADGRLGANPSGGVGPYTYAWSNGETTPTIEGLLPGAYSVTVTDFNLEQASANVTLNAGDYGFVNWQSGDLFNWGNGLCMNSTTIGFDTAGLELLGPPPFFIGGVQLDTQWLEEYPGGPTFPILARPLFNPIYGQTNVFTFTDGNGCQGTYHAQIGWPVQWPTLSTAGIQGACDGTTSGSITLSSTGEGHQQFVQATIEPPLSSNPSYSTGGAPSTIIITGLAAGSYTLTQFMSMTSFLPSSGCNDTFNFTIPSLGPDCGVVSGTAYVDNNQDCTPSGGEPYIPGTIVEIQPGPYYLLTDAQGRYEQVLPLGSYTVEQQSATFQEHCTGAPIAFTISSGTPIVTADLPDTSLVGMDAMVAITSSTARPGFHFNYALRVANLTPTSTGAVTVTLAIDPTLQYIGASPAPSNVNGNLLTWNQSSMGAWLERNFSISTMVPPDINLLGTQLLSTATLSTVNTDGDLTNNAATNLRTITGAYDPNDKLAYSSMGSTEMWLIGEDEWIDYTIRFQNTGTDTAFTVIVADTLPITLDPGTIQWGASSHVSTRALIGQGIVRFTFANILLPDSNVNEPRSHGFVSFRIRPHLPLLPGTTIENTANIYFDFNDAVITEPSVLVAEFSTEVGTTVAKAAGVYPNPAVDRIISSCPECGSVPHSVTIQTVDGKVVLRTVLSSGSQGIDISVLANGAYLLHAIGTKGSSVTSFIKQSSR